MTSLVFRALDHHVVHGMADHLAFDDETVTLTYAQLLAQVAAFAGGLAQVGVEEGSHVALDLRGSYEVVAVLACARLGAIPDAEATTLRIEGDPPVVHSGDHDYPWSTVLSAGKTDPAPSPEQDELGYEALMVDQFEDIFAALTAGEAIT
ncbi:MAG: AMP-binding protein [Aeromicrobium sp.]